VAHKNVLCDRKVSEKAGVLMHDGDAAMLRIPLKWQPNIATTFHARRPQPSLGFNWHLSLFESPFGTLGIEALMDGTFSARYNGRPACELIGV
jgi:hypothetical protein